MNVYQSRTLIMLAFQMKTVSFYGVGLARLRGNLYFFVSIIGALGKRIKIKTRVDCAISLQAKRRANVANKDPSAWLKCQRIDDAANLQIEVIIGGLTKGCKGGPSPGN